MITFWLAETYAAARKAIQYQYLSPVDNIALSENTFESRMRAVSGDAAELVIIYGAEKNPKFNDICALAHHRGFKVTSRGRLR